MRSHAVLNIYLVKARNRKHQRQKGFESVTSWSREPCVWRHMLYTTPHFSYINNVILMHTAVHACMLGHVCARCVLHVPSAFTTKNCQDNAPASQMYRSKLERSFCVNWISQRFYHLSTTWQFFFKHNNTTLDKSPNKTLYPARKSQEYWVYKMLK